MRYCKRGHDTEAVGRTRSHNCRECLRAWDRERNTRRRADPAYRAAEADYKGAWWHARGYFLESNRRHARGVDQFDALRKQLRESATPEQIAFYDRIGLLADLPEHEPYEPKPYREYVATASAERRERYPWQFSRVTKEAVEAKAALPLYRHLRELAGIAS